jgi:hypothetical protein
MITTSYPPETGWIAVRQVELMAAAEQYRRTQAARRPRTLNRRRARALDWLRVWTPNMYRTEQAQ